MTISCVSGSSLWSPFGDITRALGACKPGPTSQVTPPKAATRVPSSSIIRVLSKFDANWWATDENHVQKSRTCCSRVRGHKPHLLSSTPVQHVQTSLAAVVNLNRRHSAWPGVAAPVRAFFANKVSSIKPHYQSCCGGAGPSPEAREFEARCSSTRVSVAPLPRNAGRTSESRGA